MSKFQRWIPAFIVMSVIYIASSTPAADIPDYGIWDTLVKKGGHMLGYGILSTTYWYGFGFNKKKGWLAWLLAVLYAATDEFHQTFTPGRHPSVVDVLLFDGGGAAAGLSILAAWLRLRKPGLVKKNSS